MAVSNNGLKSFQLGEAATAHLDVKLNTTDGKVYLAGLNDEILGTLERGGASGDYVAVRMKNMPGTRKVTLATSCLLGSRLFGAASGKVGTAASGGPARWVALQAGSGSGSVIEVAPAEKNGLLATGTADSTAVTTSSTETDFDVSKSINGAELVAGDVIEVFAQGVATATNSTDTLTIKLYMATEVIATIAATDVANSDAFSIHAFITIETAGASGKLRAGGWTAIGASGTGAATHFRLASASEDISAALVAVKVSAKWSTTNSGNSCKLEQLVVKRHRQ
jgi:hypothetical protein